jgi:hypothetical protein
MLRPRELMTADLPGDADEATVDAGLADDAGMPRCAGWMRLRWGSPDEPADRVGLRLRGTTVRSM